MVPVVIPIAYLRLLGCACVESSYLSLVTDPGVNESLALVGVLLLVFYGNRLNYLVQTTHI